MVPAGFRHLPMVLHSVRCNVMKVMIDLAAGFSKKAEALASLAKG